MIIFWRIFLAVIGTGLWHPLHAQILQQSPAVAYLVPKWQVGDERTYQVTSLHAKVYWNKDTSYLAYDTGIMLVKFDSISTHDRAFHFKVRYTGGTSHKDHQLSKEMAKARESMDLHFVSTANGKFAKFVNANEAQNKLREFIIDKKAAYAKDPDALKELAKWEEMLRQEQQLLLFFTGEFQQLTTFLSERVSFKEVLRGNASIKPLDGSPLQPAMASLKASWVNESIKATLTQDTEWIKTPEPGLAAKSNSTEFKETRHQIIAEVDLDANRWPERSLNFQTMLSKNTEHFKSRLIVRLP